MYRQVGRPVAPLQLGRNHSGRFACQNIGIGAAGLLALRLRADFAARATRVFVALRRFKNPTGGLPGSLDELVPGYLESLPADPFDGRPLRYSKARGVVYSVGEALLDFGGSEETDLRRALEDRRQPTLILGL